MKKTIVALLCVSMLALMPACAYRRKKDEDTKHSKRETKRTYEKTVKKPRKGKSGKVTEETMSRTERTGETWIDEK